MREVRIAIVGAGRMGRAHAMAYKYCSRTTRPAETEHRNRPHHSYLRSTRLDERVTAGLSGRKTPACTDDPGRIISIVAGWLQVIADTK